MTQLSPEFVASLQQTAAEYLMAMPPETTNSEAVNLVEAFQNSVFDALTADVLHPVQWPDKLPAEHPIRSKNLFIRLWNAEEWRNFWKVVDLQDRTEDKETKADLSGVLSWLVILYSVCDSTGVKIFSSIRPKESGRVTVDVLPVDDVAAINGMIERFKSPSGMLITEPLYSQGMVINGLATPEVDHVAKNFEATNTLTSSGE